jgi:integrase
MRFHRLRHLRLRHLEATYLLVAGSHLKMVSKRLNHSTLAITTERYLQARRATTEGG